MFLLLLLLLLLLPIHMPYITYNTYYAGTTNVLTLSFVTIKSGYNTYCHWLKERALWEYRAEVKLSRHRPNFAMSDPFRDFSLTLFSLIESKISEQASQHVPTEEPNNGF